MEPHEQFLDYMRWADGGPRAGSKYPERSAALMPSILHRIPSPDEPPDEGEPPVPPGAARLPRPFVPPGWRTPKRKLPSPVQRESLADWRRAAERLRAILLVAADLYRGRPGEPDDWAAIGAEWRTDPRARQGWLGLMREHGWDPEAWKRKRPLADEFAALTRAVLHWLHLGRLVPVPAWPEGRLRVELFPEPHTGLAGILAGQLMAVLEAPVGPYRCAACRRPYLPKRRPRGARHFCERPRCGRRASNRLSARRSREAQRAASK